MASLVSGSVVSHQFAEALHAYTTAREDHRTHGGDDAIEAMWHALNHCHHYGKRNIALKGLLISMNDEYHATLRRHVATQTDRTRRSEVQA